MLDDDCDPAAAEHRHTEHLADRDVVIVQEVVERRDLQVVQRAVQRAVQDILQDVVVVHDRAAIEHIVAAQDRAVMQHIVQRRQVVERAADIDEPNLVLVQRLVEPDKSVDEAGSTLRLRRRWPCRRWGNEEEAQEVYKNGDCCESSLHTVLLLLASASLTGVIFEPDPICD